MSERGWTDAIYSYLNLQKPAHSGGITHYDIAHDELLEMHDLGIIPDDVLDYSQNGAPTLGNFIHDIKPLRVSGYIVPSTRSDERITVDGCIAHPEDVSFIIAHGVNPDMFDTTEDGNISLWWD